MLKLLINLILFTIILFTIRFIIKSNSTKFKKIIKIISFLITLKGFIISTLVKVESLFSFSGYHRKY